MGVVMREVDRIGWYDTLLLRLLYDVPADVQVRSPYRMRRHLSVKLELGVPVEESVDVPCQCVIAGCPSR